MAPTDDIGNRKLGGICWIFIILLLFLVPFTVLFVVLEVLPSKYTADYPVFTLNQATVYNFNFTLIGGRGANNSSFLVDTNVNVTILYLNPNRHVTISYDRLTISAVYLGEAIVVPTVLPASVQRPKIAGALSAFLNGHSVPVAGTGLDKMALIPVNITVDGWIAWDRPDWNHEWCSGKMHVNCPCFLRSGYTGDYDLQQTCIVEVDEDVFKT
ncbi:unnamed protein product [Cuscuta epithymum]|uniref:Late embryogenesis abundant protein LEA-2 subgroup domain-containing protein n=1 Tax=Cuscuta epithymum TaxID=186058 RepID=A0AAV0EYQ4_9ASTE|nr:unnamed protein product [Cuscuta epithymum]